MKGIIRKILFSIGVAGVLALILVNTWFGIQNLRRIKENGALKQETTQLQADISAVLLTLLNLETGQRGYLLTEDAAYLQPYTNVVEQLPQQFANLRTKLADRPVDELALLSQLDFATQAMVVEAAETIRLRQQGYRSRAFRIVNSNHGKELMDQARGYSASLLAAETTRLSDYEQKTTVSMEKALGTTISWNSLLILVTALVFGLVWMYSQRLERTITRGNYALREKSAQLEMFTQTVSHDLPELLRQTLSSLDDFLNQFADYLPGRGQEHAANIKDMAARSNRLMTNSLKGSAASNAA